MKVFVMVNVIAFMPVSKTSYIKKVCPFRRRIYRPSGFEIFLFSAAISVTVAF